MINFKTMKIPKTKLLLTFFISGFFLFGLAGVSEAADYIIPTSMTFVTPSTFSGVEPGDCLLMEAGVRTGITFKGFKGEPGNPILITNQDGVVDINTSYTYGWAVYIRDCQHINFSGKGDTDEYGIKISESNTGAILGYRKTEYIEIENIEITKTGIGISVKTKDDENGDPVIRGEWTQHDTTIHDCYIHDIRGEGLYIGSSSWGEGIDPALDGVYVYNNIFENIGFDGIQIGSAPDNVEVHHNYVNGSGQSTEGRPPSGANNVAGIIMGAGARGKLYNNKIINSGGRGIYANTVDEVFNNLIINTGVMGWDGISHGMTIGGGLVRYNTIINPKNDGIQIRYAIGTVRDNIIAGYGGSAVSSGGDVYNNLESSSLDTIGFVNPGGDDFHLLSDSIAVDKGSGSNYPTFDLDGNIRPFGAAPDIGAYEYGSSPATCASQSGTCCSSGQICQGGSSVSSSDCGYDCCAEGGTCEDPAATCNCGADNCCNGVGCIATGGDPDCDCRTDFGGTNCGIGGSCDAASEITNHSGFGVCCAGACADGCIHSCSTGLCFLALANAGVIAGEDCCDGTQCYKCNSGFVWDSVLGICMPLGGGIPDMGRSADHGNYFKYDKDIKLVFTEGAQFLLKIAGGLALFVLILGGVYYMISGSNPDGQTRAKKVITYAVIGLAIVLVSYVIVIVVEGIAV